MSVSFHHRRAAGAHSAQRANREHAILLTGTSTCNGPDQLVWSMCAFLAGSIAVYACLQPGSSGLNRRLVMYDKCVMYSSGHDVGIGKACMARETFRRRRGSRLGTPLGLRPTSPVRRSRARVHARVALNARAAERICKLVINQKIRGTHPTMPPF